MQNIPEPEQIHKIFLETVRFYRLAEASRSVWSMWWKSLLWTVICRCLSHSATSSSARTFVFQQTLQTIVHSVLFGTAVLILTGKKQQAIAPKTHGPVTGTAQQSGDSQPRALGWAGATASSSTKPCHPPSAATQHTLPQPGVICLTTQANCKL